MGNEERELQGEGNRTWTPAQYLYVHHFLTVYTLQNWRVRRDVSPTSQLEIQIKVGHLPWAKEQTSRVIDVEKLFNDYWTSKAHDLTVPGQL